MRVALTGAGGYVGRAVLRALLARGHSVAALVRGAASIDPPVAVVRGDVRDPAALETLVQGAAVVVHAAAWVHRRAERPADRVRCRAVNVEGTAAVIAAARAAHVQHLVFVSTTAVYGGATDGLDENAPPHPITTYGATKLEAERAVLDAAAAGVITACVLRPCVVYGPGAPGNTARLLDLVRRGALPLVRGGANRKSLVHVDDLAGAIVKAAEAGRQLNGRVFNVAGPPVTVREMGEALARGAGLELRTVPVPAAPLAAGAALARLGSRLTRGLLPDWGRTVEVFAETSTVDGSASVRDLGASYRDPIAGLEQAARGA